MTHISFGIIGYVAFGFCVLSIALGAVILPAFARSLRGCHHHMNGDFITLPDGRVITECQICHQRTQVEPAIELHREDEM